MCSMLMHVPSSSITLHHITSHYITLQIFEGDAQILAAVEEFTSTQSVEVCHTTAAAAIAAAQKSSDTYVLWWCVAAEPMWLIYILSLLPYMLCSQCSVWWLSSTAWPCEEQEQEGCGCGWLPHTATRCTASSQQHAVLCCRETYVATCYMHASFAALIYLLLLFLG